MNDPFIITERIKPNIFEFEFMSFASFVREIKEAVSRGILKSNKRYKIMIKEV